MITKLELYLFKLREVQASPSYCLECGRPVQRPRLRHRECRQDLETAAELDREYRLTRYAEFPELFARYRRDHAERHR